MQESLFYPRLETMAARSCRASRAWPMLWLAALLCFAALLLGQVEATRGDSFGQLVVAQSIIKNGTIELDRYQAFFQKSDGSYDYDVRWRGGHLYHYFPIGVPLVALPVVALANLAGFDMRDYDSAAQRVLAAATGATIVLLLALMARIYFSPRTAVMVGMLGFFGTVIGPTVGMALSTSGFEILFVGAAALLLLKASHGRRLTGHAWMLGVLLFLAYVCRPTAVAVIGPILAYLFVTDRRALLICGTTLALFMALFMGWSLSEYHMLLPPYYSASRLGWSHVGTALRGAFLGPSRNILIFNPFIPVLIAVFWMSRRLSRQALLLPCAFAASGLGFFVINIASPEWTGFWSYGPRLSCTMAFVFFVCCLCLWGELANRKLIKGYFLGVLIVAQVAGLVINLPGLYNPYTWYWNSFPNITQHADPVALDWRFPQFMASRSSLIQKNLAQSRDFGLPSVAQVPLRGNIVLAGGNAEGASDGFSWDSDNPATLAFRVLSVGNHTLSISVNGKPVGEKLIGSGATSFSVFVPGPVLSGSDGANQIVFSDRALPGGLGFLVVGYSMRAIGSGVSQ